MSPFQNYCGGRIAYLNGMSQSLRSVRLVSGLPHNILKEAHHDDERASRLPDVQPLG